MPREKLLIFTLIFLLTLSLLSAQDTWVMEYEPFGSEANYVVEDILICSDGGYAVNGFYTKNDPDECWGYLMKTDSAGNLLWAKRDTVNFQMENESRAIIETNDGGILSASYRMTGGTAMIKRDAEGNREWVNLLDYIYAKSMCKALDGNIILAGSNWENQEEWPTLAKTNYNTEYIWDQTYVFNDYDFGAIRAVNISSDGGYLLTGTLYSQSSRNDAFVIKTNADGDSLWSRIYGNEEIHDYGFTIIEVDENNILVGGYVDDLSGIVWKLNSNGDTLFLQLPQAVHNSFAKLDNNSIISMSKWYGNYINKFDSDYTVEWTNDFPLYFGNGDKCLSETLYNHIVVASWNGDNGKIAIVKLNSDGTNIDEEVIQPIDVVLSNYPNPFNPSTTISFNIKEENPRTNLSVFNIKGQKIATLFDGYKSVGNHTIKWDAGNLASGVYLFKLSVDRNTKTIKTVLLK